MIIACALGIWIGTEPEQNGNVEPGSDSGGDEVVLDIQEPDPEMAEDQPPLFFFANVRPGDDFSIALGQLRLAAAAGVHRHIVRAALPWGDEDAEVEQAVARVGEVLEADPEAGLFIYVSLDMPGEWIEVHQDDVYRNAGGDFFPSLASEAWLEDSQKALKRLIETLGGSAHRERILGYMLGCLTEGGWYSQNGRDLSAANQIGFKKWLELRYGADSVLAESWGEKELTLATAVIPEKEEFNSEAGIQSRLYLGPQMQGYIDFSEYTADSTVAAIEAFARRVKESAGTETEVVVPYGFVFELTDNFSGHLGLGRLLKSEYVDSFASPVSKTDRGSGGTGGFVGPVDSARYHGKKWYLIDDTRTGVSFNPSSGTIEKMKGLRSEDVANVQARNFSAAASHGLGLIWTDPEGQGWLHDEETWARFGRMRGFYKLFEPGERGETKSELDTDTHRREIDPSQNPNVIVVLDEKSRHFERNLPGDADRILRQVVDSVLQAGISAQFCLLTDLIDGLTPKAPVYIFPNLTRLRPDEREKVHSVLRDSGAAALWLYAPGLINGEISADNITATTGLTTKAFENPEMAGSIYQLSGRWLSEGQEIGESELIHPLFYIETTDSNSIAKYKKSGKTSVAVEFLEQGWTSVYVADPVFDANLLREILTILEQHMFLQRTTAGSRETVFVGNNMIAIHARTAGERIIELEWNSDVVGVLDSSQGWPKNRKLSLPINSGVTRLLRIKPIESR